jgi:hypothetical protein
MIPMAGLSSFDWSRFLVRGQPLSVFGSLTEILHRFKLPLTFANPCFDILKLIIEHLWGFDFHGVLTFGVNEWVFVGFCADPGAFCAAYLAKNTPQNGAK